MKIGPNQELWLQALESDKYEQGKYVLCKLFGDTKKYCCLGVACELFATEKSLFDEFGEMVYVENDSVWSDSAAPSSVVDALGLYDGYGSNMSGEESLANLNDDYDMSFKEIAAMIRETPSNWFKESK